jgi:hypothetical protein
MPSYRAFTADDAIRAAEAAMAGVCGYPIRLEHVADLGGPERRNLILRATASGPDGAARPVIVKATRVEGYDATSVDAWRTSGLIKEWAAKALPGADSSPALLAADLIQGVLVFEDAGADLPSLVQTLLHGTAAEAECALTAYATALGRLHAATAGRAAEHAALVRAALPNAEVPPRGRTWIERVVSKAPALLGGTLPEDELTLIEGRLLAPGPWTSLVHGDPCPDNVVLTSTGEALLLDFEFSVFGHALFDAGYWWMGFPTCWCAGALPVAVSRRLDAAYRAAADQRGVDDAAFVRESAIVNAAWLFDSLAWLLEPALADDEAWGTASRRARILHYLDVTIRRTGEAGVLPGINAVAASWRAQLAGLWPSSTPLGLYPAFSAGPA